MFAGAVALDRGVVLAIVAALLFGSLGVFTKLAYAEGWNVPSLLAVRFVLAALTVLPFALRERSSWRTFGIAYLIGAIGYTTTTALYFPSIELLPAAVAAFLLYLAPAMVAVLAMFVLRERLGPRGIVALVLALAGLALLASGAFDGTLSAFGVLLAALSAVSYAVTTVLSRGVAQRMPWSHLSLGVSVGAATSYVLFSAVSGRLAFPAAPIAWVWAAGIGIVATGISLSLFMAALASTTASRVSVLSTLEPVSTLALAALFLAEVPAWTSIGGGLLIIAGAALIAREEPVTAPHE